MSASICPLGLKALESSFCESCFCCYSNGTLDQYKGAVLLDLLATFSQGNAVVPILMAVVSTQANSGVVLNPDLILKEGLATLKETIVVGRS